MPSVRPFSVPSLLHTICSSTFSTVSTENHLLADFQYSFYWILYVRRFSVPYLVYSVCSSLFSTASTKYFIFIPLPYRLSWIPYVHWFTIPSLLDPIRSSIYPSDFTCALLFNTVFIWNCMFVSYLYHLYRIQYIHRSTSSSV